MLSRLFTFSWRCKFCNTKLRGLENLRHHRFTKHHWKCDGCEKFFPFKERLDDHFDRKHRRWHVCAGCKKHGHEIKFRTPEELQKHSADHEQGHLTCDVCEEEFESGESLKAHRQTHMAIKAPGCCPLCGDEFPDRDSLAQHLLMRGEDGCIRATPGEPERVKVVTARRPVPGNF